jgi:NAD(P)-dependent dehydrogenase (short-subunit alcohol dehydrogenase family)
MQIAGSAFVVTGGASGLGRASVDLLVERGAKVAIVDLDVMRGERAVEDLGEGAAIFIAADCADERQGSRAIGMAQNAIGPLRGLVNCAGIAPAERMISKHKIHELETFTNAVRVNLIGAFNMARLVAAAMKENDPIPGGERGIIINTASIAAYDGQIGQAAYAASKGGVAAMTLPMARDLGGLGVRVMCIAPGVFSTPMVKKMPAEVKERLADLAPFPARFGEPKEFASLVAHIIENPYLNGEIIRLDGAMRMPRR